MIDMLLGPWPWFVSGPLITLTMFALLKMGKAFGISSSLRTLCAIGGAGKFSSFFQVDVKSLKWSIAFVVGVTVGGYIAAHHLSATNEIDLNPKTVVALSQLGFENPGEAYLPSEMFGVEAMKNPAKLILLILSGFLVGFGARYAGGCTSGHAISGLSNLQLPSLIVVIGFFIGGLIMTFFILPYLL